MQKSDEELKSNLSNTDDKKNNSSWLISLLFGHFTWTAPQATLHLWTHKIVNVYWEKKCNLVG